MPEGDTIFRSARTLHRALAGSVLTRFETVYAHLASVADNTPLVGRTVERVEARGKWLWMVFSGDLILLTHMRMQGSWHIYRIAERWQRRGSDMRIHLETADWQAIAFNVPVAEFHTADSLGRHMAVQQLGPDLLAEEFDATAAIARIREHAGEEIGVVLLQQKVLAGIGNVYKSEICFASCVHPFRRVSTLTQAELTQIVQTARKFLKANVVDGSGSQIVTYNGLRRTTRSTDPAARLWVYGRPGQPCRRCGGPIHSRKQGMQARTTFWCAACQPMDAGISMVQANSLEGQPQRSLRSTRDQ
ncbi:MAG TPA: DNA-formamidopyrimidine glycosylase family protein [Acidobacteriaceae bacterium]|jgi:endonuclease-8|nr:DNA-formamidopyrimidine glycosylase family protein [Acidobacteriaceae bacterium]